MTNTELRELDAWIAERVMGWSFQTFPSGPCPDVKHWYSVSPCPNDAGSSFYVGLCPYYTTDPAASMLVLERCIERGRIGSEIAKNGFIIWKDELECYKYVTEAPTLPLAVCLFA